MPATILREAISIQQYSNRLIRLVTDEIESIRGEVLAELKRNDPTLVAGSKRVARIEKFLKQIDGVINLAFERALKILEKELISFGLKVNEAEARALVGRVRKEIKAQSVEE
jgi:hypothetical protein